METWFSFASGHNVFDKFRRKSPYQHFHASSKGEKKEGSKTPPALRASTEQAWDPFSQVPNPEAVNAAPRFPLMEPNQPPAITRAGCQLPATCLCLNGETVAGEKEIPLTQVSQGEQTVPASSPKSTHFGGSLMQTKTWRWATHCRREV